MGLLDLAVDWQQMLMIMAVLSMAVGNLAAIAQTNIKRMLAYSTISHMGFMLLGLLAGVVNGNWLNAADAYSAAMFYIVVYVLTSAGRLRHGAAAVARRLRGREPGRLQGPERSAARGSPS